MKNKLLKSWCIFLFFTVVFVVAVEVCHHIKKTDVLFRCRIHPSKDLILDYVEKKNTEIAEPIQAEKVVKHTTQEEVKKEQPSKFSNFYEMTEYGFLPKISPDGERIFDNFSAKSEADTFSKKFVRVAVLLSEEDAKNIGRIISEPKVVGNCKITFIVPLYIKNLEKVANTILENGHEFFIQLPTQQCVLTNGSITPFAANADLLETRDKLKKLLSAVKGVIGIANTNPTLFTKSERDIRVVVEELASRGLAFFDFSGSNDILRNIAAKEHMVYLSATKIFDEKMDVVPSANEIWLVPSYSFRNFLRKVPQDLAIGPISGAALQHERAL